MHEDIEPREYSDGRAQYFGHRAYGEYLCTLHGLSHTYVGCLCCVPLHAGVCIDEVQARFERKAEAIQDGRGRICRQLKGSGLPFAIETDPRRLLIGCKAYGAAS